MANGFITVKEIARQTLPRLIENLVFPNLIHKDFSDDFLPKILSTPKLHATLKGISDFLKLS